MSLGSLWHRLQWKRFLFPEGPAPDPCPEINIDGTDDLVLVIGQVGLAPLEYSFAITGGEGPYSIQSLAGTKPDGLAITIDSENAPDYYLRIAGYDMLPGDKGTYTVIVTIADNNGCTAQRKYTLRCYMGFTTEGSGTTINPGANEFTIPVSGMGNPVVADGIYGLFMNIFASEVGDLNINIVDPGNTYQVDLSYGFGNSPAVQGANFFFTHFIQGNTTALNTGTAPYSGQFNPGWIGDNGFNEYIGVNPNGDWKFNIANASGNTYGGAALLIFK